MKTPTPHTKYWPDKVGRLIINFSCLEFETYLWLVQLSEQPQQLPQFAKQKFAQRTRKINEFIDLRAHTANWKSNSKAAWAEALDLAKLRNRIAHNPLAFTWDSPDEKGEPDNIGIMETQGASRANGEIFLSKTSIEQSVNKIAALVKRLEALRKEWCEWRDSQPGKE